MRRADGRHGPTIGKVVITWCIAHLGDCLALRVPVVVKVGSKVVVRAELA